MKNFIWSLLVAAMIASPAIAGENLQFPYKWDVGANP